VTGEPLGSAARVALRRVHARVRSHRRRPFFDGLYVTWNDLRHDPASASSGPTVQSGRWDDNPRGGGRQPVSWHELAWHGVAMRGPARTKVEVWTDPATLIAWTRKNMADYWRRWHARARRPLSLLGVASLGSWAPAWGVLGVARQRYTLATGRITSKHDAGVYARDAFDARWHPIIDECLRLRAGGAQRSRYANPFARRRDMLDCMDAMMTEVLGPASEPRA
jgi:hypothetical protein